MQGYDIIGDIHGHAGALYRLLEKLGYRNDSGVYRHPSRKVIYLGDFIDRGPDQKEVIKIARSMCEAGAALAVMGNHEFNALAWATKRGDGTHLRPHTEANFNQHKEFLSQIGEGSRAYHEVLAWFRSLPLWLKLPGLRIVHACWHTDSQRILETSGAVGSKQRLTDTGLHMMTTRDSPEYKAAEVLLKGPEIKLPDGRSFLDKDGHHRTEARLRWWDKSATTFRTAALGMEGREHELPDGPVSHDYHPGEAVPVFFGHYWLDGKPALTNAFTACLDYSVASKGYLTSYRWTGERTLLVENLVWETALTPLEKAIEIALSAHAGKVDKAGAPYVLHPLRMMLRMKDPTSMMVAVLHDVVEDGPGWTFDRLAEEGIPADVIEAVTYVTKRTGEETDDWPGYEKFILRAASHPVALRVKLADLEDNMDLGRISNPTGKDFARLEKYRRAYALLRRRLDGDLESGTPAAVTDMAAATSTI